MSYGNLRGMLLEEAVLFLLSKSGYRTKTDSDVSRDPTLCNGHSGIEVCGRGGKHQIDAVADCIVHHPFSHPQRLLVEAKCYQDDDPVGLPILRGAVGLVKDVNEFWETRDGVAQKYRYHYQYSIFSASGFSSDAEQYAFAHDINIFPVGDSAFLRPVLEAIRNVEIETGKTDGKVELKDVRKYVRAHLQSGFITRPTLTRPPDWHLPLAPFFDSCKRLRFALLTVFGSRFPVLLVPNPSVVATGPKRSYTVRIFRDQQDRTWIVTDAENRDRVLFSFDLPRKLFLEYANGDVLDDAAALELKEMNMAQFRSFYLFGPARQEQVGLVTFNIDKDWISRLKSDIAQVP